MSDDTVTCTQSGVKIQINHYSCNGCGRDVTDTFDDGEVRRATLAVTHPQQPAIRLCHECVYKAATLMVAALKGAKDVE